jgi:hypothetical protein
VSFVISLNMAYPFGGSTAASMGVCFTPRIRRFSHNGNPQLCGVQEILYSS